MKVQDGLLVIHRPAAMLGAVLLTVAASGCVHTSSPETKNRADARQATEPGYGAWSGRAGTGAVSTLTARDFRDRPAVQIEELLEGRLAGVRVVRSPGGGIKLHIRGVSTFYGSNEPLYVVDGMPVYVSPGQGLDWLSPGDIERVEVLKDAGTTAIYGMRGANGVVLITTVNGR